MLESCRDLNYPLKRSVRFRFLVFAAEESLRKVGGQTLTGRSSLVRLRRVGILLWSGSAFGAALGARAWTRSVLVCVMRDCGWLGDEWF